MSLLSKSSEQWITDHLTEKDEIYGAPEAHEGKMFAIQNMPLQPIPLTETNGEIETEIETDIEPAIETEIEKYIDT